LIAAVAFTATADALPYTSFTPNASGGFDAFVYPVVADGTPSLLSDIFTLPTQVNPGWVVIVEDPSLSNKNTSNWSVIAHFIDNGNGKATTLQLLTGGPDQADYFPSVNKVFNQPHAFIAENLSGFSDFTDYSVRTQVTRNYHFYTAAFPIADSGSTFILLGIAFTALIVFRRKLRQT
jgi:hypothetical protein